MLDRAFVSSAIISVQIKTDADAKHPAANVFLNHLTSEKPVSAEDIKPNFLKK